MKTWKKLFWNNIHVFVFLVLIATFFYPFILFGKIPIPADTIVGMYHPWRDAFADSFPLGMPIKNYLITDPVRQQFIWRKLAIEQLKNQNLPLWNPYAFSGTPLLANFQSAVFYPFNIIFFILPFVWTWGILVVLQPLLAGVFLYFYLRYMNISSFGSFIGAFSFSFSGFSIAWLEWNTVGHVVLWLPLILLAKEHLIKKLSFKWVVILIFSEISQILAGHLQILFYTYLISNLYLIVRIIQLSDRERKGIGLLKYIIYKYTPFLIMGLAVLTITAIQWIPTLQFIKFSARDVDQGVFDKDGWFIPWQNLLQFLAPDYFGNPATFNYWGIWNYAEFIGYVGIIPLILALFAIFFRFDKKTLFFSSLLFIGLLFSLPTPIAKIPYILRIPLISTSQPTRLIYVIDFSLSVLAGLGFDCYIRNRNSKKILFVVLLILLLYFVLWLFTLGYKFLHIPIPDSYIQISNRNLIFPTLIFIASSVCLFLYPLVRVKIKNIFPPMVMLIFVIDLFRFGWKFTPFTRIESIFPDTKLINIVKNKIGNGRMLSLDSRVMPPNFSSIYHIQDISGYDPLYLKSYGQLIAAWERNKPDISPASFNRIVTPHNFTSIIPDLLSVSYFLSYETLKSEKLEYVASEGKTYLYKNLNVMPRAFLVDEVIEVDTLQEEIERMFTLGSNLRHIAVVSDKVNLVAEKVKPYESAEIYEYDEDHISIKTKTENTRLVVLTDIYYPSWKVYIDDRKTDLLRVDFILRGVIVPPGEHRIEFKVGLI